MTANGVQQIGRIKSLDVAKFLGLLLVCYCHIPLNDGYFNTWAYSFHMPLFFFVSGLFLKPENLVLSKTGFRLLLLFCIFNFVLWIFDFLHISFITHIWSLSNLHAGWIFSGMYPSEPSWFLIALFILNVCTAVSVNRLGLMLTTCLISVLCISYVFFPNCLIWKYFHLNSVVIAWPFYIIGYICRYYNFDINILCRWKGQVTLLLGVMTFFSVFNEKVNIWDGCYGNNFLMYILGGLLGTLLVIKVSSMVKVPDSILSVYSAGALFIICMHMRISQYLFVAFSKINVITLSNNYDVLQKVLLTCLTFVLSYPIIKFLLCFFPESLGKKRYMK